MLDKLISMIKYRMNRLKIFEKVMGLLGIAFLLIIFTVAIIKPEEVIIKQWMIIAFSLGGILIVVAIFHSKYSSKTTKLQIEALLIYLGHSDEREKELKGQLTKTIDNLYDQMLIKMQKEN
ncbi:MAG: hypothetical protein DAHOPDDO_00612 [Ignavibacteriaceae bacterium]|nr:hypothetical protein [Ignavibacteriaceae bacterium]